MSFFIYFFPPILHTTYVLELLMFAFCIYLLFEQKLRHLLTVKVNIRAFQIKKYRSRHKYNN
jgi:hypothetical protein